MPTNILIHQPWKTAPKWLVAGGDQVAAGDLIAEIETDKAIMEVEAFDDGRIGKLPHFYLTADLEIEALLELRHEINSASATGADGKPLFHVSLTDMVVVAMAMALEEVPDANVTWTEGGMLRHKHADIGVAVAVPSGGLITPIIRAANTKKLSELSHEMKDLVGRARERKLAPDEYQGGVTSIINLGMYAIREFAAAINPPQSSILAVGAGELRPVVRKGEITKATMMTVTLATDHRAVDGITGAELLKAFRHHIEKPAGMLV